MDEALAVVAEMAALDYTADFLGLANYFSKEEIKCYAARIHEGVEEKLIEDVRRMWELGA